MVLKGIRFGMMLQLAIGPICLMVVRTASLYGFFIALLFVLAVATVDACYITLAGAGVGAVINKPDIKKICKIFGCSVLLIFGLMNIAGAFGFRLLPSISLFSEADGKNIFLQGLILTASNPMTIIFWSGVFSAQVAAHSLTRRQLLFFGAGCVLSTLLFLSALAMLGCFVGGFLTPTVIQCLNAAVGAMLILSGIRLLKSRSGSGAIYKKETEAKIAEGEER